MVSDKIWSTKYLHLKQNGKQKTSFQDMSKGQKDDVMSDCVFQVVISLRPVVGM